LISELESKEKALLATSILISLPGIVFIYYGEELGMKGKYNELSNEQQLEPYMWYEIGYGLGQTEWKAYSANPPFNNKSYEIQELNPESYYNSFKNIMLFRNENEELFRNSHIEKIKVENNLLFIYSKNKQKRFATVHNLNNYKKHYRFTTDKISKINGIANIKKNEAFIYPYSSIFIQEEI
jgi:glycosidase